MMAVVEMFPEWPAWSAFSLLSFCIQCAELDDKRPSHHHPFASVISGIPFDCREHRTPPKSKKPCHLSPDQEHRMSATSQSAGPKSANKRQTNPIQRVDLPGGPSSTPSGIVGGRILIRQPFRTSVARCCRELFLCGQTNGWCRGDSRRRIWKRDAGTDFARDHYDCRDGLMGSFSETWWP
jgi:hypothetical protein